MLPSALTGFLCDWYKEGVESNGGTPPPKPKRDIGARQKASEGEASHKPASKMRWAVSAGEPDTDNISSQAGKGKVTSEGESRYVQRNQRGARECTGFSPVEKESGIVRTLRGVTNCPNIPATRALWVRTPQLWESQQENRQTRLSFGGQINLASYLPWDNIAFLLEKQRPEISEGGISFCCGFPGEELATYWAQQTGLVLEVEFLAGPIYGGLSS